MSLNLQVDTLLIGKILTVRRDKEAVINAERSPESNAALMIR